jgi:hypothetical protein
MQTRLDVAWTLQQTLAEGNDRLRRLLSRLQVPGEVECAAAIAGRRTSALR